MEQTRRDIEAETRRAIDEIRREVADLTVMATEKVTRKTLTEEDQRRLVEEALSELDFSALSAAEALGRARSTRWRRSPRSTRGPLFEVAVEQDSLDEIREQLDQFADAHAREPRAGGVLLLALLLGRRRRRRVCSGRFSDADPALHELPRGADRAPSDAGDLPHPHRVRPRCGTRSTGCCRCRSPARSSWTARPSRIGERIGEQVDRQDRDDQRRSIPTSSGGVMLRVGNFILDASIRNRLEQLRKQVAQA